jgi:hypothetical protein
VGISLILKVEFMERLLQSACVGVLLAIIIGINWNFIAMLWLNW